MQDIPSTIILQLFLLFVLSNEAHGACYTSTPRNLIQESGTISLKGAFENKDICQWEFPNPSHSYLLKMNLTYLLPACSYGGYFGKLGGPGYSGCGPITDESAAECFIYVTPSMSSACSAQIASNPECTNYTISTVPFTVNYKATSSIEQNDFGFILDYQVINCLKPMTTAATTTTSSTARRATTPSGVDDNTEQVTTPDISTKALGTATSTPSKTFTTGTKENTAEDTTAPNSAEASNPNALIPAAAAGSGLLLILILVIVVIIIKRRKRYQPHGSDPETELTMRAAINGNKASGGKTTRRDASGTEDYDTLHAGIPANQPRYAMLDVNFDDKVQEATYDVPETPKHDVVRHDEGDAVYSVVKNSPISTQKPPQVPRNPNKNSPDEYSTLNTIGRNTDTASYDTLDHQAGAAMPEEYATISSKEAGLRSIAEGSSYDRIDFPDRTGLEHGGSITSVPSSEYESMHDNQRFPNREMRSIRIVDPVTRKESIYADMDGPGEPVVGDQGEGKIFDSDEFTDDSADEEPPGPQNKELYTIVTPKSKRKPKYT